MSINLRVAITKKKRKFLKNSQLGLELNLKSHLTKPQPTHPTGIWIAGSNLEFDLNLKCGTFSPACLLFFTCAPAQAVKISVSIKVTKSLIRIRWMIFCCEWRFRYAWDMFEIYNMPFITLRDTWDMPEIWQRYVLDIPEIQLKWNWYIPEIGLRKAWDRPEIWLRYTWDMPEIYLRYARDIPEIYLKYT